MKRSNKPVLELEDVAKRYVAGGVEVWALRGVDLEVHQGDFLAVIGPSGSGKTTLLLVAGLLEKPTRGRVLVDGVDTKNLGETRLAEYRSKYIGFIFQHFNLINRLTVIENIELALIPRGIPRRLRRKLAVEALLKVGGEKEWLYKKPLQLSGGQQQRVAIARAIVGSPRIILADEPTGAVDRKTAKTIIEIFKQLNEQNLALVVVTHDPEIANCAHEILLLRDGMIVDRRKPNIEKCILRTVG